MATEKIFLGKIKKDFEDSTIANENLYLDKHSWDCGWYWGFGYIGNRNLHCHFDGHLLYKWDVDKIFDKPQYSQGTWYNIQDLFKQAYALKNAAAVYHSGGHITSDLSISALVRDKEMETRLNSDLQKVLDMLWDILSTSKIDHKAK